MKCLIVTANVLEILELLLPHLTSHYSIHKIALTLKKPYPYIYKTIKRLSLEGVLEIISVGKSKLVKLNYKNLETYSYLSFLFSYLFKKYVNKKERERISKIVLDLLKSNNDLILIYVVSNKKLYLLGQPSVGNHLEFINKQDLSKLTGNKIVVFGNIYKFVKLILEMNIRKELGLI